MTHCIILWLLLSSGLVHASIESDPAIRASRLIARRVQSFYNFRAQIQFATWENDSTGIWQIRDTRACYEDLLRQGVPFEEVEQPSVLVPSPVRIKGDVAGVRYNAVIVSCEMARRLPLLSVILLRHGLVEARVMSAYRDHPRTSFHTMGLALDLAGFRDARGTSYSVLEDFVETPREETCKRALPVDGKARVLLELACDLYGSRLFSSVLTPNYNAGHRNHFHVDIRPDDLRFFLR